eukprot:TRINITY_DN3019_c0_g1_i1.p1 TRINITY_DN3019_c0_g1~~TRINITY_DN3019_c0_g1_i1.p1  ORF type:complete len:860 (+),score=160.30 TRINITY_DN3019_c0_g1_i1:283-2580(+)
MEALSGGRLGAYGAAFNLIPFMPEDNNSVSPATHLMTHDLEFILKSKSEYFWSMVEYEPSLMELVNSYLRYSDEEQPHDALSALILSFTLRLISDPPQGIDLALHVQHLRRRGWMDFGKVMDLISIYTARAISLSSSSPSDSQRILNTLSIVCRILFTSEPEYGMDWIKALLLASKPFTQHLPHRTLTLLSGLHGSSTEDIVPDIADNVLYILNLSWTLLSMLRAHPPLLDSLINEQPHLAAELAIYCATMHDLVLPCLCWASEGALHGRPRRAVHRAKAALSALASTILAKSMESSPSSVFAKAALVVGFGGAFDSLSADGAVLQALSPEFATWVSGHLPTLTKLSASAPTGARTPQCWTPVASSVDTTPLLSKHPSLLQLHQAAASKMASENTKNNTMVKPQQWDSAVEKAKSVVELCSDVGLGWAALALLQPQFKMNPETLINALFEIGVDTTHTSLPSVVRGLSKTASPSQALSHWAALNPSVARVAEKNESNNGSTPGPAAAVLESRSNVYDGDEFDVFRRSDISRDKVQVGKRGEEDWKSVLDDKSDIQAQKAAIVAKYEYDDEPDDSMDDFQPFGVMDADADSSTVLKRNPNHRIIDASTQSNADEEEEQEDTDYSSGYYQQQQNQPQQRFPGGAGSSAAYDDEVDDSQPQHHDSSSFRGGRGASRGGRGRGQQQHRGGGNSHRGGGGPQQQQHRGRGRGAPIATNPPASSDSGASPNNSSTNGGSGRGGGDRGRGRGGNFQPKNHDRKDQAAKKHRV